GITGEKHNSAVTSGTNLQGKDQAGIVRIGIDLQRDGLRGPKPIDIHPSPFVLGIILAFEEGTLGRVIRADRAKSDLHAPATNEDADTAGQLTPQ
ncbi:hypothetical protein ACC755_37410, partial [Rhizobium ruizarguesonis]